MQWPKTKAAAIKMAPAGNDQEALKALAAMARPLEAASLVKMRQKRAAEQRAEEPPPKNAKLAPPPSWFGNHEQNDDAEQNGESEQNADIFAAQGFSFRGMQQEQAMPAQQKPISQLQQVQLKASLKRLATSSTQCVHIAHQENWRPES